VSGHPEILKLGVTGGIGSGKTVVCKMFEALGVPVLYADDLAKDLSNSDTGIRRLIISLLGDKAYGPDGMLDRAYVARMVFSDKTIQKKVNAIIHPRVEEEIGRKFGLWERAGKRVAIVEAALVFEAGLDRSLDAVVVVDADETTRLERVVQRDRVDSESVLKRMTAQMDPAKKLRKADYIIHNNGTLRNLEESVRFLHSIFQSMTGSGT
jgi:dephospho-CoA kinase